VLSLTGLHPDEEVLTPSGYEDALVEVNGTTVGIEVDGHIISWIDSRQQVHF
jgi:hypothetical protein